MQRTQASLGDGISLLRVNESPMAAALWTLKIYFRKILLF
ncbi:protein of unknown function [Shewanella benthica]|uniref:Uncharacterized protein n=1 Tax=Shewanella benthica TaxID=43661 RepID=A0A330M449_9GAMM|nr:protein of unknown function [Shewanella benthica]